MAEPTTAEREEFKSLKTYPIEYLNPQEIHILKTLVIFGGNSTPCKVSILNFVSFFDDDTRKCFSEHSDTLRLLSKERATKSSKETLTKSAVKATAPFKKAKCFLETLEKGKFIKSIIFPPKSSWEKVLSALKTVLMNDSVEDIFSEPLFLKNKNLQFEIKFGEGGTKKIEKWLNDYLDIFIGNKLTTLFLRFHLAPLVPKSFYSYEQSVLFFRKLFKKDYINQRNTEINVGLDMLGGYWQKLEGGNSISQSPLLRPIEVILAMEKKERSFKVVAIGHDRITVKLEKALKDEIEAEASMYPERTGSAGQTSDNSRVTGILSPESSPKLEDDGYKGVLSIGTKKIPVGKVETRTYLFLKYFYPFSGKTKPITEVFNAIGIDKDNNNPSLRDRLTKIVAIKIIVENTRKEIYKILAKNESRGALQIQIRKEGVAILAKNISKRA